MLTVEPCNGFSLVYFFPLPTDLACFFLAGGAGDGGCSSFVFILAKMASIAGVGLLRDSSSFVDGADLLLPGRSLRDSVLLFFPAKGSSELESLLLLPSGDGVGVKFTCRLGL